MRNIPSISPTRTTPTDRHRGHTPDHNVNLRVLLEIDPVALIAARSGVHPATVAAQLSAWQFGGQS